MSSSPEEIANDAADAVDDAGGLSNFFREFGVGGISFALIITIIDAITSAGSLILEPFGALADGVSGLVDGTLGVGVDIIGAGGDTAIDSFTTGLAAILGPFAFPVSVGIVMLTVYIFIQGVIRIEFSPRVFISNLRP